MRNLFKKGLSVSKFLILPFLVSLIGYSTQAMAGSVHSCKTVNKVDSRTKASQHYTKCIVENSSGRVGDSIEVKNEYNYIVATGKIIRQKGRYSVVILGEIFKAVKSGYPVIERNNDSMDHWTAATAPF